MNQRYSAVIAPASGLYITNQWITGIEPQTTAGGRVATQSLAVIKRHSNDEEEI